MSFAAALAHRVVSAWKAGWGSHSASAREVSRHFSPPFLILAVSLWLAVPGNLPFWRAVWQATGGAHADNLFFLPALALCVLAWVYLLLSLVAWSRATRIVLAAVLVLSAAAGYFMDAYGMLLDSGMIASIFQTHTAEAWELMTWRLGLWVLAFGLLPAAWVIRTGVTHYSLMRELGIKALTMAIAVACLGILLFVQYQHFASLARNHRELRFMLVPHNIAAAMHGYFKRFLAVPIALEVVGADASRLVPPAGAQSKPMLLVVVVGETARAANFSLNGYGRMTNPELAQRDVLSFSNVTSCGTSTAVSLPCMFLDVGRDGFHDTLALRREGLLDVLQRAGLAVRWLDNNSGCKGVCDRVPHENLSNAQANGLCRDGECYDEILLQALRAHLDNIDRDTVIVLHMVGSHGPAYYKRYPGAFEVYTPACHTVELDRCERQAVVNAYDNTLRYTDHVLAQTIDLLQSQSGRIATAMLYVSDHGESLGESGLYLHGIPYALAPREQVHVPMLMWLSQELRQQREIDADCLRSRLAEPISHDYLYHSVLGLSNVRADIYRSDRDILRRCRS